MRRVRIQSDGTDAGTVVTIDGERVEGVMDYAIVHPLGETARVTLVLHLPVVDVVAEGRMVGRFPCCGHESACPVCEGR